MDKKTYILVLLFVIFILGIAVGIAIKPDVEVEKIVIVPLKIERQYVGEFTISHYTASADENGGYTTTSTGSPIIAGRTAAIAKGTLPYGTVVYIEGVGERVIEDCGIREGYIDVAVEDKQTAFNLGVFKAKVWIVREI